VKGKRVTVRERLPNRRRNETRDIVLGDMAFSSTIVFDKAGRPLEVFLNAGKAGSAIDALLNDAAVAISVALQHGIPSSSTVR